MLASSPGTSTHLAGGMFADMVGAKLSHIPCKGTRPAMVDVASAQVRNRSRRRH